ncbi:MAG: sulfite exporter TauE/SafE family protein, partial [Polyangiaceae bacterium]
EERGKLAGRYFDVRAGKLVHYEAQRLGLGSAIALLAGAMSGMLGVGGGFLKVPAMTLGMRVPMRVAAATSNFMIGVTAIASLSVYLVRGHVRPLLAAPLVIGVIGGSLVGTKLSRRVHARLLRIILALVLGLVAVEMGLRTFGVHLGR